jgi:phosphoribosyl 1,2-cyclic phosphodiesterase
MKVTLWGTRGSLASPGHETTRYGGNTSCVEVRAAAGPVVILDAGTGIRRLGVSLPRPLERVDLLLTHLHMDHVQGLGFFAPLYDSGVEVHIWGPGSATEDLRTRLMRYLSPPLFPVHLRDLPCRLHLHEVPCGEIEVGELRISSALVCHPGPTVGYRITSPGGAFAYLPDHEPALGAREFPVDPSWTSGYELAAGVDLLIHDAQYTAAEYPDHVGWGHSSLEHAIAFASLVAAKLLVPFHHDPAHTDEDMDRLMATAAHLAPNGLALAAAYEGATFQIGGK